MMLKLYNNHNGERKTLTADTSRINKHYSCSNQLASRTQAADASLCSLDMFQQYRMLLRKQIQYFLKGRGIYKTVLSHGISVPQTLVHWQTEAIRHSIFLSSVEHVYTNLTVCQSTNSSFHINISLNVCYCRRHLSVYLLWLVLLTIKGSKGELVLEDYDSSSSSIFV